MSTPETPTGRKTTIDTQPSTDEPDVIDDATAEVEETTSDATSDDADEAADAGDSAADDGDAEDDEDTDAEDAALRDAASAAAARRWGRIGAAALAALLLISAIVTTTLYFEIYRPDQQTGQRARDTVLDAAKAGAQSVLSYSPDTLEEDLSKAKSHLTGEFLNYYSDYAESAIRPAVRTKHVSTSAEVVRAALIEMHADRATVLAFVNQATTSDTLTSPKVAQASIKMEMQKVGNSWLIAKFDPV